jgi:hypothetical protein
LSSFEISSRERTTSPRGGVLLDVGDHRRFRNRKDIVGSFGSADLALRNTRGGHASFDMVEGAGLR